MHARHITVRASPGPWSSRQAWTPPSVSAWRSARLPHTRGASDTGFPQIAPTRSPAGAVFLVAGRRPRDNPSFTHRRSLRSRPVIFWTTPGMASLPASSTDLQRGTIHWPKACRSVLSSGAQGRLAGHPLSPSRSCVRAALPSSRAAGPRAPGAALLGSSCAGNPSSWAWASILSSSYLPRRAPHRCPPRRNVGALGGKLLSNAQASRPPPCSCEAF